MPSVSRILSAVAVTPCLPPSLPSFVTMSSHHYHSWQDSLSSTDEITLPPLLAQVMPALRNASYPSSLSSKALLSSTRPLSDSCHKWIYICALSSSSKQPTFWTHKYARSRRNTAQDDNGVLSLSHVSGPSSERMCQRAEESRDLPTPFPPMKLLCRVYGVGGMA